MAPVAYDAPQVGYSLPKGNDYNSPNMVRGSVSNTLREDQPPLGTQFQSYELNQAINHWTLDPFQYTITKFDYHFPDPRKKTEGVSIDPTDFKNNPGLVYRDVNFEKLLPAYTQTKKSVNDFPAQSYHRFKANEGYFNPKESVDNSDLWYYLADKTAQTNGLGVAGAPLNVQEVPHIIFPEPQRGGTDTRNLTKYSWSNFTEARTGSWEGENIPSVNNDQNCRFFNYNDRYTQTPFDKVYSFDSNYCRSIGISGPNQGSMPFK
jgi:hypothetical protein